MPPLPTNNSQRLVCRYLGPFGAHTLLLRYAPATAFAALVASARALITLIVPTQWLDTSWVGADYFPDGNNASQPVSGWVPIVNTTSSAPSADAAPSQFYNLVGRGSTTARRVKYYIFETAFEPNVAMRYTTAQSPSVEDLVDYLNSVASLETTIAEDKPFWKPYANVGQNDFLTHRARRTN